MRVLGILWWVMVEVARTSVRCDVWFGEFYGRVKARRGGWRAIVAVANRLFGGCVGGACFLWGVLWCVFGVV